jgi:hypothetical protein
MSRAHPTLTGLKVKKILVGLIVGLNLSCVDISRFLTDARIKRERKKFISISSHF